MMTSTVRLIASILASLSFTKHARAMEVECGPSGGTISMAGSTTVFPLATLWANKYMELCPDIAITVEVGGSGGGASRVCAVTDNKDGEPVDIATMSRPWKDKEAIPSWYGYLYQCIDSKEDRSVIKIDVAIDGIAVATKANGTAASCIEIMGGLTTHQLRWIYSNYDNEELLATGWDKASLKSSDNDDATHLWSELDPRCAPVEIVLAGSNVDSGTFEYFFETTCLDFGNGETADADRPLGYYNSPDDADILKFIETNGDAITFLRSSTEGSTPLYFVPILNPFGAYVAPTPETVSDGSYTPYSRRLYMNVLNDAASLNNTRPFLQFGFSTTGTELVGQTGYVPIQPIERQLLLETLPSSGGTIPIKPLSSSSKVVATDEDQATSESRDYDGRSFFVVAVLSTVAALFLS